MNLKYIELEGIIKSETGLMIGGNKDNIEIGGVDNSFIKHPFTDMPYIPGSSLKGKIRSLLEHRYSPTKTGNGRACDCGHCKVCKYFGCFHNERIGPTRALFRDANLTQESEKMLQEYQLSKGMISDVKTENWIDRKTGRAGRGGLRTVERVPAGTEFKFLITLRVFENDDEKDMINFIKEGLSLLEKDYLGSSGGRGYGKVKVKDLKIKDEEGNELDFPVHVEA